MRVHRSAVEDRQISVIDRIGPRVTRRGFYLAGGTAVALRLGHRVSVDLDWFTAASMGDPLRLARELSLPAQGVETAPGTLHVMIDDVPVSFLEYRYPLLEPLDRWEGAGIDVAGLDDLAAMKLSAIAQRGLRKDFLDIHALATKHRPLADLLAAYRRKYGIDDVGHVLLGLAYFDDADSEPMPRLLRSVEWEAMKAEIREWVREVA